MHTVQELKQKKCKPCEGGAQPLFGDQLSQLLLQVAAWKLGPTSRTMWREWKFQNFRQAMVFVNRVAEIAEAEGHHPDISISWNVVKLDLTTHAIGGLSENDFILAAKIDALS